MPHHTGYIKRRLCSDCSLLTSIFCSLLFSSSHISCSEPIRHKMAVNTDKIIHPRHKPSSHCIPGTSSINEQAFYCLTIMCNFLTMKDIRAWERDLLIVCLAIYNQDLIWLFPPGLQRMRTDEGSAGARMLHTLSSFTILCNNCKKKKNHEKKCYTLWSRISCSLCLQNKMNISK